jgi:DNA-binding transcriptional ArsR family regulator
VDFGFPSGRATKQGHAATKTRAAIFAALGDETRLSLMGSLASGPPRSISHLTQGSRLTRQAITKHLRVLEDVGVVRSIRAGRESLFEFRPQPLKDAQSYLERVAGQWDDALSRLRSFVEK